MNDVSHHIRRHLDVPIRVRENFGERNAMMEDLPVHHDYDIEVDPQVDQEPAMDMGLDLANEENIEGDVRVDIASSDEDPNDVLEPLEDEFDETNAEREAEEEREEEFDDLENQ